MDFQPVRKHDTLWEVWVESPDWFGSRRARVRSGDLRRWQLQFSRKVVARDLTVGTRAHFRLHTCLSWDIGRYINCPYGENTKNEVRESLKDKTTSRRHFLQHRKEAKNDQEIYATPHWLRSYLAAREVVWYKVELCWGGMPSRSVAILGRRRLFELQHTTSE